MKNHIAFFLLTAAVVFTQPIATLNAQGAATSMPRLSTLEPFSVWLGEWKGGGWSMSATGERTEFDLTETVRERVAGTVLLVEGHGVRTSGTQKGTASHDGLVLVYRDNGGRIRWNGHEAVSGLTDAEVIANGRTLQWSFNAGAPGTTVRFVIRLDGDVWQEWGEVSTDGTNWNRFMEMSLRRTGSRVPG